MTGYTTDRIHLLRGLEPTPRRPTGHVTDDDVTVSGPMTVVRLRDGTLDLVPADEVETEEGDHLVYARVPPHQLLGVWRGGRWVRAEELPPTADERPR